MAIVEVPAQDLARVLPFRSTDDVRYYLNGVLVEPIDGGGCMLVATNGHWIAMIHSQDASTDKSRILHVSPAMEEAVREAARDSLAKATIESESSRIVLAGSYERYIEPGAPFIEGKFPIWRKIIPPVEFLQPGLIAPLQSRYISALHKAADKDHYSGVKFWHDSRNPLKTSSVVRYSGCPDLIVLIMPLMRFEEKSCEWPAWFAPLATADASATDDSSKEDAA